MVAIQTTRTFERWHRRLRDHLARLRIDARIQRIIDSGNLGDHHAVGGGIWELRLEYGPGYRLYCIREGDTLIILLCGGDKDSQRRDIATARELAEQLKRE